MKDFNGVEIEVGDTVAYIEKGYRNFVRGVIAKVNEKKVAIGGGLTPRYPDDVIIVKKVVKPQEDCGCGEFGCICYTRK